MASETADPDAEGSRDDLREMRLDAAHPVRRPGGSQPKSAALAATSPDGRLSAGASFADAEADASDLPPWPSEDSAPLGASPDMLAQHAANLAERLQQRLAEVDRRESRLNSQEAEFDTRIRNARLWIDQREAELTELEQRLVGWEQQLTDRQELAAAQIEQADEIVQRLKELGEREKRVAARDLELELGLTEQQTKLDALDFERAACRTRQQELDEARQKCEQRQRELDQREAKLYVEQERASYERLAIDARQSELSARETRLTAKEASLAECERRLAEQAGEIEFQRAELQQVRTAQEAKATQLTADGRRLEFRQREIETALKRFEKLGIVEQKMDDVQRQADELAIRAAYLDKAEGVLAERQLELSTQQRELEHDRLTFENQVTRERRIMAAETQESQTKGDQRQRAVDRRAVANHAARGAGNPRRHGRDMASVARRVGAGGPVAVHRPTADAVSRSFPSGGRRSHSAARRSRSGSRRARFAATEAAGAATRAGAVG